MNLDPIILEQDLFCISSDPHEEKALLRKINILGEGREENGRSSSSQPNQPNPHKGRKSPTQQVPQDRRNILKVFYYQHRTSLV